MRRSSRTRARSCAGVTPESFIALSNTVWLSNRDRICAMRCVDVRRRTVQAARND